MRWNGKRNAQVEIPYQYWNRTCGLCGNFDGDYMNDFVTPDGSLVSDQVQSGWKSAWGILGVYFCTLGN